MITEFFINIVGSLVSLVFGILPNLPDLPQSAYNSINSFLDLIFNYAGLIDVFIPLQHIKILVPLIIIVVNFEHIYNLVMWVLKKIPALNIK